MGALSIENTNLEEAQKASAAIVGERDALKAAAATAQPPTSTSSETQTEELERLQQEKVALEQALQEKSAKPPVQAPAPTPDTSELESRLVGCSSATSPTRFFSSKQGYYRLLLRRSETSFSEKRRLGISPTPR
jgi:hypothetical protein